MVVLYINLMLYKCEKYIVYNIPKNICTTEVYHLITFLMIYMMLYVFCVFADSLQHYKLIILIL
jgi:hypothetical protein